MTEVVSEATGMKSGTWVGLPAHAYWRFICGIVLGVFCACGVWLTLIDTKYLTMPESASWAAGIYSIKLAAAHRLPSPKIIFVGGSSVHFGISAELIGSELGMPAVNFGTHAGLGLQYILEASKPAVSPGDIVVFIPEYTHYQYRKRARPEVLVDHLISADRTSFRRYPVGQRVLMLMSEPTSFLLRSVMLRAAPQATSYRSETTNAFGDETSNGDEGHNLQAVVESGRMSVELKQEFRISDDAQTVLREYVAWCRAHKVTLVVSYPNTAKSFELGDTAALHARVSSFFQEQGVDVLGKPGDFSYDNRYFTDTVYHMTSSGVRIRSHQLARLLVPIVQNSHPVVGAAEQQEPANSR
jgi:hypothetical protein